ncbi:MAG TPA: RNA-binding protein [Nitrospiraceae bacterium]|nr:RNA-binding protein [Nitrospiraceae bacterium]
MKKRVLYVGGLPDELSDCALRGIFTSYGLVARAYVVRFKHTGKSAGYGFVEMGSAEQALNAVVALEGTEWDGHPLRIYVTPYAHQAV